MITLSALMAALSVSFMYVGNILPTGRLGIIAVASLFVTAAVIEAGLSAGVFVYAGSGLLAALILPDKSSALLFGLFFGYYPLVKSLAERIGKIVLTWAVKLTVFNAAFAVGWFLFRKLLFDADTFTVNTLVAFALGNLVFVVYDLGLTKLISFYIVRISKYLKKEKRRY